MFAVDGVGSGSPSYSWKPHELATASYPPYYNTSFQQFSSSNITPSMYNYNYTNASNTYNVSDQSRPKPYTPPVSYMGNSINSVQFDTTNAQQYSSSPSVNAYTNLHYVNANVGTSIQNQVQYKGSSKVHCLEFPELEKMTNEELVKLGKDEDLMDEFLEKHTKLREIDSAIEDAIDWVEKTACEFPNNHVESYLERLYFSTEFFVLAMNLSKEQQLAELREEVAEKAETMETLKARYDKLVEQYNKLSEVFAPEHIRDCLSQAADESQEQSEVIAQDFLDRKIDVERFLSTYVECRKLGQARRTKEEKLTHQLNELKRAHR